METETLEDHVRRATRNFTSPLPEDQVLALGRDLARELARAHAESPPRHPDLDPRSIAMPGGVPRLEGGTAEGDAAEDLFTLGALLCSLATGTEPNVSWLLDGPPAPPLSTLSRRALLGALAAPRQADRFASAAVAAAALEAVLTAAPARPAPWPLFRGDAGRTGARPGPVAASLQPLWEAMTGAVVGSPVVTGDVVVAATADGRLVWLDRESGRLLHEMRLAAAVESSPALGEDQRMLHAGTDDGEMVGVDIVEGRERYRVKVGRLVRSSPLPLGGRVIVGVVEGKSGGMVVALDAAKGALVWARKMGPVFSSPALAGANVVVGSDDGFVHALDPAKGTVVWSAEMGAKVRATPAVAGETAVVADFAGRLTALRVSDGGKAWAAELGHAAYSSPCVRGELAVVGCNEGHVHALELRGGAARFEVRTRGPVVSSPVAAGERIVVGSTDGGLYLVDEQGRVADRREIAPGGIQSSAALDADHLFIGSARGVHALRLVP
jgi:outer membrane protein assembly factor BamB